MRLRIVSALVTTVALVCAPGALADTTYSSNWAGYAAHGPAASFRQVSGSWRQPSVSCTPGRQSYSSYWVGLGGYSQNSNALEQIGTEADCGAQGNVTLSAWYELVPAAAVPINMTIRPGDTMFASVTVSGHRVLVSLDDATRGRAFSKTLSSGSIDVTSAEWIVEAPSSCFGSGACTVLPLANFALAAFTGASAQSTAGHSGSVSDPAWGATRIDLSPTGRRFVTLGASGQPAAIATSLHQGGSAFAVAYARSGQALFSPRRLLASVAVSVKH